MDKDLYGFLAEGMKKYKEASRLLVHFGKNIEKELQDILTQRREWGCFVPDKTKKKRSTTFWHEYPLLNADIFGFINDDQCTIRIAINWYQADEDYPYYSVGFENCNDDLVNKLLESYNQQDDTFIVKEKGILFYPDPEDFNLNRDSNLLLDEFISVLK